MFGRKKQPPIKSLIAPDTVITGNILFGDGLRIDGQVLGNVTAHAGASSMLVISETARVQGEVCADHIIINGAVHGPVHAHELLELQPKARVEGDVTYKAMEMHQGAIILGKLQPVQVLDAALPMLADESESAPLKLETSNG